MVNLSLIGWKTLLEKEKNVGYQINSLPNKKNVRLVQIEKSCRRQNKCELRFEISFGKGRKHSGKKAKMPVTNAGYQHFLLF